jgi:hypothetical protein
LADGKLCMNQNGVLILAGFARFELERKFAEAFLEIVRSGIHAGSLV